MVEVGVGLSADQAAVCAATLNMAIVKQRAARIVRAQLQLEKRRAADDRAAPVRPFGSACHQGPTEAPVDVVPCARCSKASVSVPADSSEDTVRAALCNKCTDHMQREANRVKRMVRPQFRPNAQQVLSRITPEELELLEREMNPW
ncbi:Uncharacterized protein PBTT_08272 [Plasmodiophora brassicae]|uniref:Uncharacterized protein n=1 Tax=Plasmodiophora brassicae TaxID=37360 RepID=A0A0G4IJZ8_PLABS|nr:hypothetical protein PBRA_004143 [Plasmodiophora brassicae]SPR00294.1 unnamed protein product [Plasmodiophora brassicae]